MNHNDVLRSLRYMLKVNDAKMAEIIGLTGLDVNPVVLATYVKKEEEEAAEEAKKAEEEALKQTEEEKANEEVIIIDVDPVAVHGE